MSKFNDILEKMKDIHDEKDSRYSNSFGRTRVKHKNAIAVVLNFKLNRLETLLEHPELENDESINDTLLDMANYCVMEMVERQQEAELIEKAMEVLKHGF